MGRVRRDFDPERALRHLAKLRTAANWLGAVDECGGLPGGKAILRQIHDLADRLERLIYAQRQEAP